MGGAATGFEGTSGRLAGAVMARLNRDMEDAAVEELDPDPGHKVLALGFGPGVGIVSLVSRLPDGLAAGVDPSSAMVEQAIRRNRAAVNAGRAQLVAAGAESIPWPEGTFDGALAVNSVQFWQPLRASLREVARVLVPGAPLVTVTHCWAIEKRMSLASWVERTSEALHLCGFDGVTQRTARFRSGEGLMLRASRASRASRAPDAPAHDG
jgi:ubiquinone/menaquinone biosynthesis C-methylase UbiE